MLRVGTTSLALLVMLVALNFGQTAQATQGSNIIVQNGQTVTVGTDGDYEEINNAIVNSGGQLIVNEGLVNGNIIVRSGGLLLVSNSFIGNNIVVQQGADVTIIGSTVCGNVVSTRANTIVVSSSTIHGSVSVTGTTGLVDIGSNQIDGQVLIVNNDTSDGNYLVSNTIGGNVVFTGNDTDGPDGNFVDSNIIDGNVLSLNNDPDPDFSTSTVDGCVIAF